MLAAELGPVASIANPYLKLLEEKLSGKISLEEFHLALYTSVIQDSKLLNDYRCRPLPTKLFQLQQDEDELFADLNRENDEEVTQAMKHKFLEKAQKKYPQYFQQKEMVLSMNDSNRYFLKEMHDFFKERNSICAEKVREVLTTYEQW